MKLLLTAVLLASTAIAPAFAEEIKTQSRIDAVIVFPQGADVMRVAQAQLVAGEHSLILDDLPASIDPQSIRVEGEGGQGLEISAVDSRLVQLSSDAIDIQHKKLNEAIEVLSDERAVLVQKTIDAEYQRKLLLSIAEKQAGPADAAKPIDATQLGDLIDLVGVRLANISASIQTAQLRQRAIDREIGDLQTKQSTLAPDAQAHMQVVVHVTSAANMQGKFKLRYRVSEAGWVPFYDARLGIETANLNIVRRAEVTQNTGEVWSDVALTLSTARPLAATAAPDLGEDQLQIIDNPDPKMKDRSSYDAVAAAPAKLARKAVSNAAEGELDVPALQAEAEFKAVGFNTNYLIAGRSTVDNSGTAKKLRIGTDDVSVKLQAIAVPRLDLAAYLTASFTVQTDAAMLPGAVNLYRDGIYVGQGRLPLVSSGEEAKLGFGADDMIKVKRAEVKRNVGEEGILSSSNVQEMAWDISVTNLHAMAIPVTVIDRAPYSSQEDVLVEALAGATPATLKDFEKRRGVLAWNFDLEAKAEKQIKTGYKVTSPKSVNISLAE
jgi:uncharacterized protein (TIGR02231 family)